LNAELEELENEELTERLKDASAPPVFVPEPEYSNLTIIYFVFNY
jgi:hypothetical protein